MSFMRTAKDGMHALGHLRSRHETAGFGHLALTVDPGRLNRIEPGALDRQGARDDAHAAAGAFDLLVVRTDPGAHLLAAVPGGIVPDQEQGRRAAGVQFRAAPVKELGRQRTDGAAVDAAQPRLLLPLAGVGPCAHDDAVAGQGFGIGVVFRDRLFDQAHGLVLVGPGMAGGLGQAAPPTLILETQRPGGMSSGQAHQTVALAFFRVYSGSGLVIQCLARNQRTPHWARTARMVSPVTRRGVILWRAASAAAKSSVHRLVSCPKSRGERCSRARRRSTCSAVTTLWGRVCGTQEPRRKAATPRALKATMASRTVWSSQPRTRAIRGAWSPRALARTIWARRSVKASDERSAVLSASRSSALKGRTKIGCLIPFSIAHSRLPFLRKH